MSTFVTVGNATQPFDRLLRAISDMTVDLPAPIVVQRGSSTMSHPAWDRRDFVGMDDFERLITESRILIMHAGAGSVIHAVRAGRVPVVMPRRARYSEHVDDHQMEFAQALASTGHVMLAGEPAELRSAVRSVLNSHRKGAVEQTPLVEHIGQLLARLATENR